MQKALSLPGFVILASLCIAAILSAQEGEPPRMTLERLFQPGAFDVRTFDPPPIVDPPIIRSVAGSIPTDDLKTLPLSSSIIFHLEASAVAGFVARPPNDPKADRLRMAVRREEKCLPEGEAKSLKNMVRPTGLLTPCGRRDPPSAVMCGRCPRGSRFAVRRPGEGGRAGGSCILCAPTQDKESANSVPDRDQLTPILRTKLYRPPEPEHILCRQALHHLLDSGPRAHRCQVV
jgi:hypothetical protein